MSFTKLDEPLKVLLSLDHLEYARLEKWSEPFLVKPVLLIEQVHVPGVGEGQLKETLVDHRTSFFEDLLNLNSIACPQVLTEIPFPIVLLPLLYEVYRLILGVTARRLLGIISIAERRGPKDL